MDFGALASRMSAGLEGVRACLIVSGDGLALGAHPDGAENRAKDVWDRLSAVGDPQRGFFNVGDELWVVARRGWYAALLIASPSVRPGIALDRLGSYLKIAEEARVGEATERGTRGGRPDPARRARPAGRREAKPQPKAAQPKQPEPKPQRATQPPSPASVPPSPRPSIPPSPRPEPVRQAPPPAPPPPPPPPPPPAVSPAPEPPASPSEPAAPELSAAPPQVEPLVEPPVAAPAELRPEPEPQTEPVPETPPAQQLETPPEPEPEVASPEPAVASTGMDDAAAPTKALAPSPTVEMASPPGEAPIAQPEPAVEPQFEAEPEPQLEAEPEPHPEPQPESQPVVEAADPDPRRVVLDMTMAETPAAPDGADEVKDSDGEADDATETRRAAEVDRVALTREFAQLFADMEGTADES